MLPIRERYSKFPFPIKRVCNIFTIISFIGFFYFTVQRLNQTNASNQRSMKEAFDYSRSQTKIAIFQSEIIPFYETVREEFIKNINHLPRDGDFGISTTPHRRLASANLKIPLDRILPDERPRECKHWHYRLSNESQVSFLIAGREGDLLKRTIYSLFLNTPRHLIKEIIVGFPDSFQRSTFLSHLKYVSTRGCIFDWLNKDMEEYRDRLPHLLSDIVEVFEQKSTLVVVSGDMSQIYNSLASNAKGDFFMFLPDNFEPGINWLLPLLSPILEDYRTVTIPTIGTLDSKSLNTLETKFHRHSLLNWGLLRSLPESSPPFGMEHFNASLPYQTLLIPQESFLISSKFYHEVNGLNPKYMHRDEYNLELSLRLYRLGSRVLTVPCSVIYRLKLFPPLTYVSRINDLVWSDYEFKLECVHYELARFWLDSDLMEAFATHQPELSFVCGRNNHSSGDFNVDSLSQHWNNGPAKFMNSFVAYETPKNKFHYESEDLAQKSRSNFELVNEKFNINTNKEKGSNNSNKLPYLKMRLFDKPPKKNRFVGSLKNTKSAVCADLESRELADELPLQGSYCSWDKYSLRSTFRLDFDGYLFSDRFCLSFKQLEGNFSLFGINYVSTQNHCLKWVYDEKIGLLKSNIEDKCLVYERETGFDLKACSSSSPEQRFTWI